MFVLVVGPRPAFAGDGSLAVSGAGATPTAFSPNGDGTRDAATLSATFTASAGTGLAVDDARALANARRAPFFLDSTVVIRGPGATGPAVHTLTSRQTVDPILRPKGTPANGFTLAIPFSILWNGRTDAAVVAPDGLYTVLVSAALRRGLPSPPGRGAGGEGGRGEQTLALSNTVSTTVILDTTPPAVSIASVTAEAHGNTITAPNPPDGTLLADATPTFTVDYADALSGVDVSTFHAARNVFFDLTSDAAAASATATVAISAGHSFPEGSSNFGAQITDAAGNTGLASVSVVVDTVGPTITFTPADGTSAAAAVGFAITVTISDATTAVDPASVVIRVNGVDQTSLFTRTGDTWSFTPSISVLAGFVLGPNTIEASARDLAANPSSASATFTLVQPAEGTPSLFPPPPAGEPSPIVLHLFSGGGTALIGRCAADPVMKVSATIEGAPAEGIPISFQFTLGNGFVVEAPGFRETTDANGLAAVRVVFGDEAGTQTVEARVSGEEGGSVATVTYQAQSPAFTLIPPVLPEGETILQDIPGSAWPAMLKFEAAGLNGAPLAGEPVTLLLTDGAGQPLANPQTVGEFVPEVPMTDAEGRAMTTFVLNAAAQTGPVHVRAFLRDFPSVAVPIEGAVQDPATFAFSTRRFCPDSPDELVRLGIDSGQAQIGEHDMTLVHPLTVQLYRNNAASGPFQVVCQHQCPGEPDPSTVTFHFRAAFFTIVEGSGELQPAGGIFQPQAYGDQGQVISATVQLDGSGKASVLLKFGTKTEPHLVDTGLSVFVLNPPCSGGGGGGGIGGVGAAFAAGVPEVRIVPAGDLPRIEAVPIPDPAVFLNEVISDPETFQIEVRVPLASSAAPSSLTVRALDACGEPTLADIYAPPVTRLLALSDAGTGGDRYLALRSSSLLGKIRPHVLHLLPGVPQGGEGGENAIFPDVFPDFGGSELPPLVVPLPDSVVRTDNAIEAEAIVGGQTVKADFGAAAQVAAPNVPLTKPGLVNQMLNLCSVEEIGLTIKTDGRFRNFKIIMETTESGKAAHLDKGEFVLPGGTGNPLESPLFAEPQKAFNVTYRAPGVQEGGAETFDVLERLSKGPDFGRDRVAVHVGPPMKVLPLVVHVFSGTGHASAQQQATITAAVARANEIWKQACIRFDMTLKAETDPDLQNGTDDKTDDFRQALVPGKLDAFLVSDLSNATVVQETSVVIHPFGLTRDHMAAPDRRIVQFNGTVVDTLAHELGHALGLPDRYKMVLGTGGTVTPEPLADGDRVRLMCAKQTMFVLIPSKIQTARSTDVGQ